MKELRIPISEVFASIQGEGPWIGQQVVFVRVAGCDSDCPWCDTKYAQNASRGTLMTSTEILQAILECSPPVHRVVFTGGNPALYDFDAVALALLNQGGIEMAVETQGTKWPQWMVWADLTVISPKRYQPKLELPLWLKWSTTVLKLVVFTHDDFEWAREMHRGYSDLLMYLQTGNDDLDVDSPIYLLEKTRQIVEWAQADPEMRDVAILPQLHVLLWGNRRGV